MESTSIIKYITDKYPEIVFTSKLYIFGFITDRNHNIIGFCDNCEGYNEGEAKMYKLDIPVPIDTENSHVITDLNNEDLEGILGMSSDIIPKNIIVNIFKKMPNNINYRIFYDSLSNKMLFVKKKYIKNINEIVNTYKNYVTEIVNCTNKILDEKTKIIDSIKMYKERILDYLGNKDITVNQMKKLHNLSIHEREYLNKSLNNLLLSLCYAKQENCDNIIPDLKLFIQDIDEELLKIKELSSQSYLQGILKDNHMEECKKKILHEKDIIIEQIKEYNKCSSFF